MASMDCIWSPLFRTHYLDNCLSNLSGSSAGFMPNDQICELVVHESKARMPSNSNPANDYFNRYVWTRLVLISKDVREHFYRDTSATEHYQHSSAPDASGDIRHVTKRLLKQRAFIKVPGRENVMRGGGAIAGAIDLFGLGCAAILRGGRVEDYKNRILSRVVSPVEEQEEPDSEEEDEDTYYDDHDDQLDII